MNLDVENIFCHSCKKKLTYNNLTGVYICPCGSIRIFNFIKEYILFFDKLEISFLARNQENLILIQTNERSVQRTFNEFFKDQRFKDYKNFSDLYLTIQKIHNNLIFI